MKVITVRNLTLQFDGDQITAGNKSKQALDAIRLINALLQREPYGLGAQIIPDGLLAEEQDMDL